MKRSPLGRDLEKVRAMQQRARERAAERAREKPRKPIERSGGLSRAPKAKGGRPTPYRVPAQRGAPHGPAEGPMAPLEWRETVWTLDGGRCVACGRSVPLDADHWVWQAHHCIPKQRLRRERMHHLVWHPDNGVTLCRRCHERHESATERVPGGTLPARVTRFALTIAPWGRDALNAPHPGAIPAAGTSGDQEV